MVGVRGRVQQLAPVPTRAHGHSRAQNVAGQTGRVARILGLSHAPGTQAGGARLRGVRVCTAHA